MSCEDSYSDDFDSDDEPKTLISKYKNSNLENSFPPPSNCRSKMMSYPYFPSIHYSPPNYKKNNCMASDSGRLLQKRNISDKNRSLSISFRKPISSTMSKLENTPFRPNAQSYGTNFNYAKNLHHKTSATVPTTKHIMNHASRRLLSARKLRIDDLRNQIVDLNRKIEDQQKEYKILKKLFERQQKELTRIEQSHNEIPDLEKAHDEELRIIRTMNRKLQEKIKDLEFKLKEKNDEMKRQLHIFQNLKQTLEQQLHSEREHLKRIKVLTCKLKAKEDLCKKLNREMEIKKKELSNEKFKHEETKFQLKSLNAMSNTEFSANKSVENLNFPTDKIKDLVQKTLKQKFHSQILYKNSQTSLPSKKYTKTTVSCKIPQYAEKLSKARKILNSQSSLSVSLQNLSLHDSPFIVPPLSTHHSTEFKVCVNDNNQQFNPNSKFVALDDYETTKLSKLDNRK